MAMIPDDEIDKIKRTADLAAVIRSRGIELKPKGGDLIGLCPFHPDKSPSLHATPAKGLWRCMSCQATGNVIQFVQRFDGVSFRHAYELLKGGGAAVFTGAPTCQPVKKTTVPRLASPLAANADDQAALRQVLDYYHERLKENPAALAFLKKRGIAAETIATFKIGFVDRTLGLRLPQKNRKEGAEMRARLTRLGLLRKTGHEHLRGCVVFPVIAENGEIGTVYGRAIDAPTKDDRHFFLPGPQRGIFNPAALRSPEVILTEGIIDALSFWAAGYRHVVTGYSAKPLPQELLDAVIAAKVRRVFIAYDRDKAGDDNAPLVAAQLTAHGIESLRVMFPPGYDANRYALEVTPPEKSLGVLLRAALPMGENGKAKVSAPVASASSHVMPAPSSLAAKAALVAADEARQREEGVSPEARPRGEERRCPSGQRDEQPAPVAEEKTSVPTPIVTLPEAATSAQALAAKEENPGLVHAVPVTTVPSVPVVIPSPVVVVKNDADEIVLALGNREWRVRGLAKNSGFESLKVTLRVSCMERWHMDNLDLCVARLRAAFIVAAAAETLLKPDLIKCDLGHVLAKLEELQEARLKAQVEPKKTAADIPAALLAQAWALVRNPNLWELIAEHAALCGIAGERSNVLLGYLAAVSRLLDRPIMIIIQSSSAAGKTTLMDAILAFMPTDQRIKYSAMTGQALFYMAGTDLKHKILAIVEEAGAEKASYALKLLQSEGELCIASTGKDPHTGRMETQEYRVEGPVMIILTTTSADLDDELQNRSLVLTVDESREQTKRIHALQREARTETGLARKAQRAELLALHRAAQTLLRPLPVFNPYAEKLRFLSDQLRTRRDHEKYLLLIDTLAVLFQHQRERKMIEGREHIVATLDDIARAGALANEALGRGLDDMPPQTRRLLGLIQQMEKERSQRTDAGATPPHKDRVQGPGPCWRRRDLRAFTGWGDTQLKIHLGRLVELEYVLASRDPEHLNGQVYELLFDGDVAAAQPHLSGLIDVETLRIHDYEKNRSGQNEGRSGVGRPLVGGQSGVGRGDEKPDSSSESTPEKRPDDENTQPGPDKNDAAA